MHPRLIVLLLAVSPGGCGPADDSFPDAAAERAIDSRSYALGGIGAFAEMVDVGVKQLGLSSPLPPNEMDLLIEEAERIAANHDVNLYRERDFLVTDLFSAELTDGKDVLLIYRGATLEEYLDLKEKKRRALDSGQYDEATRLEIARQLGALLSYPEERIGELLDSRR
jgi:hypothetical protein